MKQWINEWTSAWMHECTNVSVHEWINGMKEWKAETKEMNKIKEMKSNGMGRNGTKWKGMEWMNERTKSRVNESMNQQSPANQWGNEWMNEWMNEWNDDSVNQWLSESMNQDTSEVVSWWINELLTAQMSMNQWIHEPMAWGEDGWMDGWMDAWVGELYFSLLSSDTFYAERPLRWEEAPLLSATSSLSSHLSGILLPWAAS